MRLPYNLLLILLPPTLALHLSISHNPASTLSPTTYLGHLIFPLLLISFCPSQTSATPPPITGLHLQVPRFFPENEVEGKEQKSYGDPSDYPNGAQESGADKRIKIPRVFAFPSLVLNAVVSRREGIAAAVVEKRELCVPRTITRMSPLPPISPPLISLYKTLDGSRRDGEYVSGEEAIHFGCCNWELLPRP
jgi:hypothetical protein